MLGTLLALACAPPGSDTDDVVVSIDLLPQPPRVGTARLALAVRDADDEPLDVADLLVEGNMSHAGMVPSFAELSPAGPGRWSGTLELTMGGDWFLLVQGRLADGRRLERVVDLPGVRPAGEAR